MSATNPTPDALEAPAVAEPPLYGLVAEFASDEDLVEAARRLRDAGYTRWDAYSPYPVHGIDQAMGIRPTRLPWFVLGAGITGGILAMLLQWWTNAVDYPYIISGKPLFSLPANIPVTFEVIILFSAFTTFLGMIALNRLTEFYHPLFGSEIFRRVTTDRFAIAIEAADPSFDPEATRRQLDQAGALAVEEVRHAEASARFPRFVWLALLSATIVLLVPPALVARARAMKSPNPPLRYDNGMGVQPKLKPQAASAFFADGRAQRLPVAGTVARGDGQLDDHLYRGRVDGEWAKSLPMAATPQLARRGQERFNISCSPCHGIAGYGDGPTAKRAEQLAEGTWVPPTSIHADHVKAQPDGELFNTITHGIRNMMGYGSRIAPEDRWAIVLYLRALQRSQDSAAADIPPDVVPAPK